LQVFDLTNEKQQLQVQINDLLSKTQKLESQVEQLLCKEKDLKSKVQDLEATKLHFEMLSNNLRGKNQQLDSQMEHLRNNNAALESIIKDLKVEKNHSAELEPVQNFSTGPIHPVQLLDRSDPADERPVQKPLQIGKSRQRVTNILGCLGSSKKRTSRKHPFS
jgi:uncharacterized phage infection (PIP) family protein YhgE